MTEGTEFTYVVKVPKDRIAVLIGAKGETKQQLEKATQTTLTIDSTEGDIHLTGTDALQLYLAREIVRAIARGFNPNTAFLLIKQDVGFEVISINAKNKDDLVRLRGRLIGEQGKSRRIIEELTGAYLSVYGKTVGILGEYDDLRAAHKAVEMLLEGAPHAVVYKMLEKRRRTKKYTPLSSETSTEIEQH